MNQGNGFSVLHVDDEPDFADLTAEFLEREDERISVQTATSADEGLEHLAESEIDCIVSDYDMPEQNGIEFLETVRENHPTLPFILYTGKGSEEVASQAISSGVTDYLQKETGTDQYSLLTNRIANAVESQRHEQRLQFLETFESKLTDLSIDFLRAEERDKDAIIEEGLETIGRLVEADRSYVFEIDHEAETLSNAHEWCAESVDSQIDQLQDLPLDAFPWWMQKLEKFENILVPDVSELPPEAVTLQEVLQEQNISSLIVTPMISNGELVGFIGFDWVTEQEAWSDEFIDILRTTGELITNARRREARRRELERHEAYLEQAQDSITVVDADGTVKFQSDSVEETTGYRPPEILGESGFEYVHPEDRQKVTELFTSNLGNPGKTTKAELRVESKDGSWRWVEVRGVNKLDDPVIDGIVTSARDITERKNREVELQHLKERLELAVEGANLGVWDWDMETDVVTRHVNLREMLGYSPAEFGDELSDWEQLVHPEGKSKHDEALRKHIETRSEFYECDYRLQAKSGDWKWIRNIGKVVEWAGDRSPKRAVGIHIDIDDQKRREAELARQVERLDEFASVVSHDLRNPLNVAQGRIELARENCESEHLDTAASSIDRSLELIEDMLSLARAGEQVKAMEAVDLRSMVADCWDQVLTVESTLSTELDSRIQADKSRMRQLLENLFRNAVEHGGDDVTVTVGELPDGFYVEDDGPGIPPEKRDEVFDAGFSTNADGTGFGLRIVKEISDAHGWAVSVIEGSNGGARFEITNIEFVGE